MKKLSLLTVASILMLAIVTSCGKKSQYPGYKTTDNGLDYQFYVQNEGDLPQIDELVEVTLACNVNDTTVIIPNSKNILKMAEPHFPGDFMEGIAMMHKGDSASFIVNIDSTFKYLFGVPTLPEEFKSTDIMRFDVKLNDFYPESEYINKMIETMKAKDPEKTAAAASELQEYLSTNGVTATPTASGLYYVMSKDGNGEMPAKENMVKVHYTGKLLDGTVFDSSVERGEPIEFPLGVGYVIPGWDEGIALMSKGEKGVLYIPWFLGYGDRGAGGLIQPYANLVFEVELVDFE